MLENLETPDSPERSGWHKRLPPQCQRIAASSCLHVMQRLHLEAHESEGGPCLPKIYLHLPSLLLVDQQLGLSFSLPTWRNYWF